MIIKRRTSLMTHTLAIGLVAALVLANMAIIGAAATSISFGEILSGTINAAAQMDSYTFSANTNDKVVLRASRTSGTLYPGIRLYGPDGAKLQETYSSPTAEISYQLPGSGTYTISTYDGWDGTRTGGYNLYLQSVTDPVSATSPTPIFTSTPITPTPAKPTPIPTPVATPTITHTLTQSPTLTPAPTIITKSCSNGDTLEKTETMSKASNPCWGWVRTHTYVLDQPYFVSIINARINMGMSELGRMVPVEIQISSDGVNFRTILSTEAMADPSTMTPFSVIVNDNLKAVRLYSKDNYVDNSTISVYSTTTSVPTTPVPTTPTPKPASTPLQTPANTQNPNPTKTPITTEPPVTSTPSKSETNWTLLGGALLAILLIGAVVLRMHKPKESTTKAVEKTIPEDKLSQKDINITSAFGYKGATILYKIKVESTMSAPIADIKISLFVPNVFLLLEKEKSLALLKPGESKTVTFEIRPSGECGDCEVSGKVTYYDTASNRTKEMDIDSKMLSIVCPMLKVKEISEVEWHNMVSNLFETEESTKEIDMPAETLFTMVSRIIKDMHMHMLKPEVTQNQKLFNGVARFYGEGVKGLRYAAQVEVVGGARKSKLILKAWAEKEDALTGFYHGILDEIEKRVNVKGYIDDSIVQYNVHIGDRIGTQVKDSIVQRSNIGAGAKTCPNCGREVEANEKFCKDCGARL